MQSPTGITSPRSDDILAKYRLTLENAKKSNQLVLAKHYPKSKTKKKNPFVCCVAPTPSQYDDSDGDSSDDSSAASSVNSEIAAAAAAAVELTASPMREPQQHHQQFGPNNPVVILPKLQLGKKPTLKNATFRSPTNGSSNVVGVSRSVLQTSRFQRSNTDVAVSGDDRDGNNRTLVNKYRKSGTIAAVTSQRKQQQQDDPSISSMGSSSSDDSSSDDSSLAGRKDTGIRSSKRQNNTEAAQALAAVRMALNKQQGNISHATVEARTNTPQLPIDPPMILKTTGAKPINEVFLTVDTFSSSHTKPTPFGLAPGVISDDDSSSSSSSSDDDSNILESSDKVQAQAGISAYIDLLQNPHISEVSTTVASTSIGGISGGGNEGHNPLHVTSKIERNTRDPNSGVLTSPPRNQIVDDDFLYLSSDDSEDDILMFGRSKDQNDTPDDDDAAYMETEDDLNQILKKISERSHLRKQHADEEEQIAREAARVEAAPTYDEDDAFLSDFGIPVRTKKANDEDANHGEQSDGILLSYSDEAALGIPAKNIAASDNTGNIIANVDSCDTNDGNLMISYSKEAAIDTVDSTLSDTCEHDIGNDHVDKLEKKKKEEILIAPSGNTNDTANNTDVYVDNASNSMMMSYSEEAAIQASYSMSANIYNDDDKNDHFENSKNKDEGTIFTPEKFHSQHYTSTSSDNYVSTSLANDHIDSNISEVEKDGSAVENLFYLALKTPLPKEAFEIPLEALQMPLPCDDNDEYLDNDCDNSGTYELMSDPIQIDSNTAAAPWPPMFDTSWPPLPSRTISNNSTALWSSHNDDQCRIEDSKDQVNTTAPYPLPSPRTSQHNSTTSLWNVPTIIVDSSPKLDIHPTINKQNLSDKSIQVATTTVSNEHFHNYDSKEDQINNNKEEQDTSNAQDTYYDQQELGFNDQGQDSFTSNTNNNKDRDNNAITAKNIMESNSKEEQSPQTSPQAQQSPQKKYRDLFLTIGDSQEENTATVQHGSTLSGGDDATIGSSRRASPVGASTQELEVLNAMIAAEATTMGRSGTAIAEAVSNKDNDTSTFPTSATVHTVIAVATNSDFHKNHPYHKKFQQERQQCEKQDIEFSGLMAPSQSNDRTNEHSLSVKSTASSHWATSATTSNDHYDTINNNDDGTRSSAMESDLDLPVSDFFGTNVGTDIIYGSAVGDYRESVQGSMYQWIQNNNNHNNSVTVGFQSSKSNDVDDDADDIVRRTSSPCPSLQRAISPCSSSPTSSLPPPRPTAPSSPSASVVQLPLTQSLLMPQSTSLTPNSMMVTPGNDIGTVASDDVSSAEDVVLISDDPLNSIFLPQDPIVESLKGDERIRYGNPLRLSTSMLSDDDDDNFMKDYNEIHAIDNGGNCANGTESNIHSTTSLATDTNLRMQETHSKEKIEILKIENEDNVLDTLALKEIESKDETVLKEEETGPERDKDYKEMVMNEEETEVDHETNVEELNNDNDDNSKILRQKELDEDIKKSLEEDGICFEHEKEDKDMDMKEKEKKVDNEAKLEDFIYGDDDNSEELIKRKRHEEIENSLGEEKLDSENKKEDKETDMKKEEQEVDHETKVEICINDNDENSEELLQKKRDEEIEKSMMSSSMIDDTTQNDKEDMEEDGVIHHFKPSRRHKRHHHHHRTLLRDDQNDNNEIDMVGDDANGYACDEEEICRERQSEIVASMMSDSIPGDVPPGEFDVKNNRETFIIAKDEYNYDSDDTDTKKKRTEIEIESSMMSGSMAKTLGVCDTDNDGDSNACIAKNNIETINYHEKSVAPSMCVGGIVSDNDIIDSTHSSNDDSLVIVVTDNNRTNQVKKLIVEKNTPIIAPTAVIENDEATTNITRGKYLHTMKASPTISDMKPIKHTALHKYETTASIADTATKSNIVTKIASPLKRIIPRRIPSPAKPLAIKKKKDHYIDDISLLDAMFFKAMTLQRVASYPHLMRRDLSPESLMFDHLPPLPDDVVDDVMELQLYDELPSKNLDVDENDLDDRLKTLLKKTTNNTILRVKKLQELDKEDEGITSSTTTTTPVTMLELQPKVKTKGIDDRKFNREGKDESLAPDEEEYNERQPHHYVHNQCDDDDEPLAPDENEFQMFRNDNKQQFHHASAIRDHEDDAEPLAPDEEEFQKKIESDPSTTTNLWDNFEGEDDDEDDADDSKEENDTNNVRDQKLNKQLINNDVDDGFEPLAPDEQEEMEKRQITDREYINVDDSNEDNEPLMPDEEYCDSDDEDVDDDEALALFASTPQKTVVATVTNQRYWSNDRENADHENANNTRESEKSEVFTKEESSSESDADADEEVDYTQLFLSIGSKETPENHSEIVKEKKKNISVKNFAPSNNKLKKKKQLVSKSQKVEDAANGEKIVSTPKRGKSSKPSNISKGKLQPPKKNNSDRHHQEEHPIQIKKQPSKFKSTDKESESLQRVLNSKAFAILSKAQDMAQNGATFDDMKAVHKEASRAGIPSHFVRKVFDKGESMDLTCICLDDGGRLVSLGNAKRSKNQPTKKTSIVVNDNVEEEKCNHQQSDHEDNVYLPVTQSQSSLGDQIDRDNNIIGNKYTHNNSKSSENAKTAANDIVEEEEFNRQENDHEEKVLLPITQSQSNEKGPSSPEDILKKIDCSSKESKRSKKTKKNKRQQRRDLRKLMEEQEDEELDLELCQEHDQANVNDPNQEESHIDQDMGDILCHDDKSMCSNFTPPLNYDDDIDNIEKHRIDYTSDDGGCSNEEDNIQSLPTEIIKTVSHEKTKSKKKERKKTRHGNTNENYDRTISDRYDVGDVNVEVSYTDGLETKLSVVESDELNGKGLKNEHQQRNSNKKRQLVGQQQKTPETVSGEHLERMDKFFEQREAMLLRKKGTGFMNSWSSPFTKVSSVVNPWSTSKTQHGAIRQGTTSELRRMGINTVLNEGSGPTIFLPTGLFIGGVEAANTLKKGLFNVGKIRSVAVHQQWKMTRKERCHMHEGYKGVHKYSLLEMSDPFAKPDVFDRLPWERREVKQRFFYERSVEIARNWFGELKMTRGNDRHHAPICHPKSMEMPMEREFMPEKGEWDEGWYTTWHSRKDNPNNLILHEQDEMDNSFSYFSQSDDGRSMNDHSDDLTEDSAFRENEDGTDYASQFTKDTNESWEEVPEVGTICTIRLKIGENVSRVHYCWTSRLRRSRWRRKFFPRGTFPY